MKNYTLKSFNNLSLQERIFKFSNLLGKKFFSIAFFPFLFSILPLLNYATISSSIKKDFNANPIPGGSYIWFSCIVDLTKANSFPVTIAFTEQSITSAAFTLYPPDASVTLNSTGTATTTYSNGTLLTIIPQSIDGIYFLSGYMFQVPGGGYAGNLQDVTWAGLFSVSKPNITIDWKWSAAVYTNFTTDYNAIGIKPLDAATGSIYLNNDKSGAPENYKAFLIPGATGGGGTSYTGGYSPWAPTMRGTIINPPGIQLTEVDALCYGGSSGNVNSSVVGGCAPFSYTWSNSASTSDLTNIGAGSYNVTITDFVGLKDSATIFVDEPPELVTQISSQTNVSCNGGNNGAASVSATGGTGAFTYSWNTSPVKTTSTATGLTAGNYMVTVTDGQGCSKSSSVTIQQPAVLVSNLIEQDNISCFDVSDGFAVIEAGGGSTPYSYNWNTTPVKTSYAVTGLAAGSYSVTVTDFKGCTVSTSVIITQPDTLTAAAFADTVAGGFNVSGCGINDGAISLSVNGGTSPYGFQWNNGATTEDLNGIGPGDYNVIVEDAHGCIAEAYQELTQPGSFEATSIVTPVVNGGYNISCNGLTNGSIDITLSGGASPFSYLWSNGDTIEDLNNVGAGIYSITVTDGNGCTTISSAIVTQPAPLSPGLALEEVFGGFNISCNGQVDGAIQMTVSGGTSPFDFQWSNGDTTESIDSLSAGIYSVTVTDANGCISTSSDTLSEPVGFSSVANAAVVTGGNNITCSGATNGSINITVSGGTPPLDFLWNNGSNSEDISNLSAGNYSVTITDANGCLTNASATLSQPAPLTSGTTSPTVFGGYNISCNGVTDGSINLTVGGGTQPYIFQWNSGATTEDLNNISAGNYSLTATDANGCITHASATLIQPNPFVSGTSSPSYNGGYNISCSGLSDGSINLSVNGGTQPYIFLWSNGEATEDISSLAADNYSVTVTDANACLTNASVILSQPAVLAADTDITKVNGDFNISCFGLSDGNIDLSVYGGTLPYTFLWNNGDSTEDINSLSAGNYSVTVTDANACIVNAAALLTQPDSLISGISADTLSGGFHVSGCNGNEGAADLTVSGGSAPFSFLWSNGEITEDLNGIGAGTYNVIITDINGCTGNSSIELTQANLFASSAISPIVAGGYNISCNGNTDGSINLTISGGASPYTYAWSNGATTEDVSGLGAGIYSVTVKDANGCTSVSSKVLTQPNPFISNPIAATFNGGYNISCMGLSDGSINLIIDGGTQPYTYLWNTGVETQDLVSLPSGIYSVTVTDANGCITNASSGLTQPELLESLVSSPTVSGGYNISCNGFSDGSVDLTVTGGTQPYSYLWNTGVQTQDVNSIPSGNYSVMVTDANACITTSSAILTQPALLATTTVPAIVNGGYNISCNGLSDGYIDLTASGGTLPYTFLWNNGAITEDIANVAAGNYSLTMSDANACISGSSATLTQPDPLISAATAAEFNGGFNISCDGLSNGSIDLTVSGGTQPYIFQWNNSAITEDVSNLGAGSFSVTITDANSCITNASAILTQPLPFVPVATAATVNGGYNISCYGLSDGEIDLTVNGGTTPLIYQWSNGSIIQDISNLEAGYYSVSITDDNGCTANESVSLTQPADLASSTISSVFNGGYNISCRELEDGYINLTCGGGTQPYVFQWNNGETTEDITNLAAGTYLVTITDANGCLSNASIALTQPEVLSSAVVSLTVNGGYNISCNNFSDGSANLLVSGGTLPYTYLWSNGAISEDLSNINAGVYTVTVTDANACTTNTTAILTQPDSLLSGTISPTVSGGYNITCFGSTDGSIDLNASGGTQPYIFLWNNGATTEDLGNLPAGNYSVTLTDANGCIMNSTAILTQPALFESDTEIYAFEGNYNISCFGMEDGSIKLTVNGGTQPYTYLWSNGAASQDLLNIPAGNYAVTVTDANACTQNTSALLTQPDSISAYIFADTINGGFHVSGCGSNEGFADLTVSGGTTPYSFLWSNGSTNEDLDSLGAGTYSVIITDRNGCTENSSVLLTQPGSIDVLSVSPQVNGGYNISCNGLADGSINLFVSGGAGPYNYLWSTGAISKDISGIEAGMYSVTITDANGCTTVSSEILIEPAPIQSSAIAAVLSSGYNVTCNGISDGSIALSVSGGTSPYVYEWSNGTAGDSLFFLDAGTYTVTVTDNNNCISIASAILSQPDSMIPATSSPVVNGSYNISCNGLANGSIDITVTGGASPYSYLWNTGVITQDIASLTAGNYAVTVTDANGCITNASATLTQPPFFSSGTVSPTVIGGYNIGCNGITNGSVNLTVNGGTQPYNFQWSNGSFTEDLINLPAGNYAVTVTDANGCISNASATLTQPDSLSAVTVLSTGPGNFNLSCNGISDGFIDLTISGGTQPYSFQWSNGSNTEDLNNVQAGNYSLTITDANACVVNVSAVLTQPDPFEYGSMLSSVNGGYNISCDGMKDGSIDLIYAAGVQPFTYSWASGDSTEDLSNLPAGNYSVTITDGNGCQISKSFNLTAPPPFSSSTVDYDVENVKCAGGTDGSINLSVAGGTSPYTFNWNNGDTSEDLYNLSGADYLVNIYDNNNCSAEVSITLIQPDNIRTMISAGDLTCSDMSDGALNLYTSGGTSPYNFQWSNGEITNDIANLKAGNYSATVTDVNGCSLVTSAEIIDPGNGLCDLEMPNGYSPNNDGKNDYFVVNGIEFRRENILTIYNRWGNEVYHKENYFNEWDGKNDNSEELPDGTYFCVLVITNENLVLKSFVDIRR